MTAEVSPAGAEWISAKDALAMLSAQGGNPVDVKAMLAEYLRDGLLKARAEAVWISTEPNLGKAWKTDAAAEEVERDIVVPVRYWRTDKRALDDRARWRWPYNKFFYTLRVKPLRRRMFGGVAFSMSDLSMLQPDRMRDERKPRRGPNPSLEARDAGWLAVVRLALDGKLHTDLLQNQNDLRAEISESLRVNGSVLGGNQVYQIARQVYPLIKPNRI